jgi:putative glutamine amidotransferase
MRVAVSVSASHTEAMPYDFLKHNYVPYFERFGIVPVLVPNSISDPGAYLDALEIEGLILTGGGDVEPGRYGQANLDSREVSALRDENESRLVTWATERNRPVLGICRGLQFLNVYFGGQLIQDIPAQLPGALNHKVGTHGVSLCDARLAALLGAEQITVNTHHHQGVTRETVAPALEVVAVAQPDGVIESVRHPAHRVIAVQWHPERPNSAVDADERLMRAFVDGTLWK